MHTRHIHNGSCKLTYCTGLTRLDYDMCLQIKVACRCSTHSSEPVWFTIIQHKSVWQYDAQDNSELFKTMAITVCWQW